MIQRSYTGETSLETEAEELCRLALPAEEARGDARRLALLWETVAIATHSRMRNDTAVEAAERALQYHYSGAGYMLDWALLLSSRSAEEGLRILDRLEGRRPPGAADLSRAVHLAMLGRFDEAWALAEARANHLREVSGFTTAGANYLSVLADIEGDRERACHHLRELLGTIPPGSEALAATYELPLARDLCYLGRYEEVEPLLRHARSVPQGPVERSLGSGVEALLLAARERLEEAEVLARTGITAAVDETDNSMLKAWSYEDLATVLETGGRTDEARAALEEALAVWERKGCLPSADRIRAQIDSLGRAAV